LAGAPHPQRPPTRAELTRELAVNAATKPLNVAVGAAVVIAGLVLGTIWLVPVAVVVYVLLAVMTFFDTREADAVARRRRGEREQAAAATQLPPARLSPRIQRFLDGALHEEQLIRQAISDSDADYVDLSSEVDDLVGALQSIARRAQRLDDYLSSQNADAIAARVRELERAQQRGPADPDRAQLIAALHEQLDTIGNAERQLEKFESEMEHTTTVLGTLHGQLVQLTVQADSLGEQRLTEQVRGLREHVGAASAAMAEVASATS
jgi:uncharacterized coiled-coil DUF342 family protein